MAAGFWERVFVGVDANANGQLEPGEKGVLPTVVDWIGQVGTGVVNTFLTGIENLLPNTALAAASQELRDAFYIIDQYFPLGLMLTYMFQLWATYAMIVIARWILKAIPTIWG